MSRREQEVLALISAGFTNPEIAAMLGVSQETVKSHAKSILKKTRARSRAQAVAVGMRAGVIW